MGLLRSTVRQYHLCNDIEFIAQNTHSPSLEDERARRFGFDRTLFLFVRNRSASSTVLRIVCCTCDLPACLCKSPVAPGLEELQPLLSLAMAPAQSPRSRSTRSRCCAERSSLIFPPCQLSSPTTSPGPQPKVACNIGALKVGTYWWIVAFPVEPGIASQMFQ